MVRRDGPAWERGPQSVSCPHAIPRLAKLGYDAQTMRFLRLLSTVALLLAAASARATPAEDAARRAFQEGTLAYNLGHFAEAVEHYEKAYKLVPDPSFLFNIAQSYRLDGKPEKALVMYRAFLREARPDEPNRKIAEKHADEIKNKLEAVKAAPAAAPAAGPAPASAASPAVAVLQPSSAPPAPQPPPPPPQPPPTPPAVQPSPLAVSPPTQPPLAPRAEAISVAAEKSAPDLTQTRAPVSQEEVGSPFYKTWWFWTGTAAVVAGGIVTALLVAGQKSKGACDGLGFSCVGIR